MGAPKVNPSISNVKFRAGDWIVSRNPAKVTQERVHRARGNSLLSPIEAKYFVRLATPQEIAEAEAREDEQKRQRAEADALRQTAEYQTAARLLCMDEKEVIERLGPDLLAQIGDKLARTSQDEGE